MKKGYLGEGKTVIGVKEVLLWIKQSYVLGQFNPKNSKTVLTPIPAEDGLGAKYDRKVVEFTEADRAGFAKESQEMFEAMLKECEDQMRMVSPTLPDGSRNPDFKDPHPDRLKIEPVVPEAPEPAAQG